MKVAPVHLGRRFSQVMLSVVSDAVPKEMARNEFGLLVNVSQMSGLDQKSIATHMAHDATTVGQLIDGLEAKGYVQRVASKADRRMKMIEITDQGRQLIEAYRPKVLKAQYDAIACLTQAEQTTLLDLLARVIEANPAHDRPGGGRRAPKSTAG